MTPAVETTLDEVINVPFRVTDLKQWAYCPRVLYYHTCLPDVRPVTYKMEAGAEAGKREEEREKRRLLRSYGVESGRREFNVPLVSESLGMRGRVDLVIWPEAQEDRAIPVDFKQARVPGEHFKLQLAAYGLMLEETFDVVVERAYLYLIPLRRAREVRLTKRLRGSVREHLDGMRAVLETERMPGPTPRRARCVSCEFRRFCNDVL